MNAMAIVVLVLCILAVGGIVCAVIWGVGKLLEATIWLVGIVLQGVVWIVGMFIALSIRGVRAGGQALAERRYAAARRRRK